VSADIVWYKRVPEIISYRPVNVTKFEQSTYLFPRQALRIEVKASTLLTSNRPVEGWGKLLGDSAAVTAMLDRLLHHGHVLKCGPRSWRAKTNLPPKESAE